MISARNNPFASCRIDALEYRFSRGGWDELFRRLHRQGFRGAIIGPYGSGKTTLLEQLSRRLEAAGRANRRIFVNSDRPCLDLAQWQEIRQAARAGEVCLIDGADLLPWWQWLAVSRLCAVGGLIIAAHRCRGLPLLQRCAPGSGQLRLLLSDLGVPVPAEQAEALWVRHHGNIRAVFRDLYMRCAAGDLLSSPVQEIP